MVAATAAMDGLVTTVLLIAVVLLSPLSRRLFQWRVGKPASKDVAERGDDNEDQELSSHPGFIVPCQIHHARMAPRESQHSFRYPSLYFAVDVQAMEAGRLNSRLGFVWKGRTASRVENQRQVGVTNLHPKDFGRKVFPDAPKDNVGHIERSMLLKLLYELRFRSYISVGPQDVDASVLESVEPGPWHREIGQVWAIAMPTIFGLAGFNPLTVFYVYRPASIAGQDRGPFWLAVLEVHNTFNERHIYVCETGKNEDVCKRKGYDNVWTFARDFHVSPFNDRLGYYQLFLRDMWKLDQAVPTIDVRLLLLAPEEQGSSKSLEQALQKKLLATLASSQASSATSKTRKHARPLTAGAIAAALAQQPFDLFLPVARIMFEAAKLHWKRKLPVYIRPEPRGEAIQRTLGSRRGGDFDGIGWPFVHNPAQESSWPDQQSGDIYWNDETGVETKCRRAVLSWLQKRTSIYEDMSVSLMSLNPEVEAVYVHGGKVEMSKTADREALLTISLLSSAAYVDLLLYPPSQAFLFGSRMERLWGVSSKSAFDMVFRTGTDEAPGRLPTSSRIASTIRSVHLRWAVRNALRARHSFTAKDYAASTEAARQLILEATKPHPMDAEGYQPSLLVALAMQVLLIMATAFFSNLFHVTYVRPPWAQVGEGIDFLVRTKDSTRCPPQESCNVP